MRWRDLHFVNRAKRQQASIGNGCGNGDYSRSSRKRSSRIFVLGGSDDVYGAGLNDVWSATDGKVWSLETATAGWSRREEHQVLSHNGRL